MNEKIEELIELHTSTSTNDKSPSVRVKAKDALEEGIMRDIIKKVKQFVNDVFSWTEVHEERLEALKRMVKEYEKTGKVDMKNYSQLR
jgi:uncharacterized protein YbjQ (UPF0145 family)